MLVKLIKLGKSWLTALLFVFSSVVSATSQSVNEQSNGHNTLFLMPYPAKLETQSGYYSLPDEFSVSVAGSHSKPNWLDRYLARLSKQLKGKSKVISLTNKGKPSLLIEIKKQLDRAPKLNDDESYSLDVTEQQIKLTAANQLGAINGLEALSQLIAFHLKEGKLLQLAIEDQPRFPWRGLLIDSVRHFIPVDAIKRQLDGMASARLNVFHWHLTDDQGWRIESKAYPKLHTHASDGKYYSRDEIKDVVAYATELGIRVVPEFDVPGHASAIARAYPELMTLQQQYPREKHWGVFKPLLDPSKPEVYLFITQIVAELSGLFPDQYLHIGGDEILPEHWELSKSVQTYMEQKGIADEHELHTYFNQRVNQILKQQGKIMMGWDEVFHPQLPKDIVVQSWRGMDSLRQISAAGYKGLLSTGFYIDQPQATSYHYRNDPLKVTDFNLDKLSSSDTIWQWSFSMPRLKGSDVKAVLTVLNASNESPNGYIEFKGRTVQPIKDLKLTGNKISFWLDSWMGPTKPEFTIDNNNKLSGIVWVGNTPYPASGEQITAKVSSDQFIALLNQLDGNPLNAENILGGEATIWSEMITDQNIDLRIWPRLYAIGEQFWSANSLSEKAMYQRLMRIEKYAKNIIGLKHMEQQQAGLAALVQNNENTKALIVLSQMLEPSHYYTRHHVKFQQDVYHQDGALDNFADFLPVESLTLVKMNQWLQQFQQGNEQAKAKIIKQLLNWQQNFEEIETVVNASAKLQDLKPLLVQARLSVSKGLTLLQQCQSNENQGTDKQIEFSFVNGEIILALNHFINRLVAHCH